MYLWSRPPYSGNGERRNMRIEKIKHYGPKELWLEFGILQKSNYHNMYWYNEGRWQETGYFIKSLLKNLFKRDRYYLVRYGGISFFLKG
jgi:hypothetical protein